MTDIELIEAIRRTVREEFAVAHGRARKRVRRERSRGADPWDAPLAAWLAQGVTREDERGVRYVEAGDAMDALGEPAAGRARLGSRIAGALGRLGWTAGGRVRRDGRKVTPYYREEGGAF